MSEERIHKKRKKNLIEKTKLERFLSVRLFLIVGGIFVFIGIFNTFKLSESLESFNRFFLTILDSTGKSGSHFKSFNIEIQVLLKYFLPPIIILFLLIFISKRQVLIANTATIIVSIYLIIIQLRILIHIFIYEFNFFPNLFIFTIFLFSPIILLTIIALSQKKWNILIFASLYFYFALLIYAVSYNVFSGFLFLYSYIFSILMYWISRKIKQPQLNLVSFVFAIGFLFQYWLRKNIIHAEIEVFEMFLIYAFFNYMIFNTIYLLSSIDKEKALSKSLQLFLSLSNLLFILGCFNFVIAHYYVVLALTVILLITNISVLYLIKKQNLSLWQLPLHYTIILLISLFFPTLVRQNMVLLFTASASITTLYYAIQFKDKISCWISIFAASLMSLYFLFLWIKSYFIVLISKDFANDYALLLHGIISGLIPILTFIAIKWLLNKNDLPISKEILSRKEYLRLIRGSLFIAIFLTLSWFIFSILFLLTRSTVFTSLGLFIAWSSYSIVVLFYYVRNDSFFRKAFLIYSIIIAFLYPFLVQINFENYRNSLITNHIFNNNAVFLHYIALILLIISGVFILKVFRRVFINNILRNGLYIINIMFILFILTTEYDNISVIFSMHAYNNSSNFLIDNDFLFLNHHLPYTIIIWLVSVCVFILAVVNRSLFQRTLSVVIFILAIFKLLIYDFITLTSETKNIIYIVSGISLIGFALLYKQFSFNEKRKHRHSRRHKHHRTHKSSQQEQLTDPQTEE